MPKTTVSLNGTICNAEDDARISVFDHGLLYGDGVFEGIRCYSGTIFRLKEHIDRLWDSARAIRLDIGWSKEEMIDHIEQTRAANGNEDCYIRVVVTRGFGDLGLSPEKCSHPQIIIIAGPIELFKDDQYKKGLTVVTVATMRNHPAALNPRIKSLNYLNNILAKIEGQNAGAEEALMLNHKGEVAEGTGDNVFLVRDGRLLTPPLDAGILEGITREAVIGLAREAKIEVREIPLTKNDVYIADECFLTGTAAEVIPVVKVDGRTIGDGTPGEITRGLIERFKALTRA